MAMSDSSIFSAVTNVTVLMPCSRETNPRSKLLTMLTTAANSKYCKVILRIFPGKVMFMWGQGGEVKRTNVNKKNKRMTT